MNVGICWRRVDLEHEGGRSAGAAKGPMSWNQANKTPVYHIIEIVSRCTIVET